MTTAFYQPFSYQRTEAELCVLVAPGQDSQPGPWTGSNYQVVDLKQIT